FVIRLEIADLIDGNEPHGSALRDRDPAQELSCRPAAYSQSLQQFLEIGGRAAHALPDSADRDGEASRQERLHGLVDRAPLERFDCVFIVGGNEYDVTPSARDTGDVESGHAGHLDVE